MSDELRPKSDDVIETEIAVVADREENWLIDGQVPPEIKEGDPVWLQKLGEIKASFQALATGVSEALYKQGQLLLTVRSMKLYKAGGFKNFKAYTQQELGVAGDYAEFLSDCARAFTEEQFLILGPTVARLGLLLLNATPEKDVPGDLFTKLLRREPNVGTPFLEASSRQILEEIRSERFALSPRPHIVPAGITDFAQNLQAAAGSAARVKLKDFSSKDAKTTGIVVEFPDARPETMEPALARIIGALVRERPPE